MFDWRAGSGRLGLVKSIRNIIGVVLVGGVCSGCLLRVEHNTTSPGAKGVSPLQGLVFIWFYLGLRSSDPLHPKLSHVGLTAPRSRAVWLQQTNFIEVLLSPVGR
jgi:hypothetical protein